MAIRSIRRLAYLHIKEQLRGFGYYLVLLVPPIVIGLVTISSPEHRSSTIRIVNQGELTGIGEVAETITDRDYATKVTRQCQRLDENDAAILSVDSNGVLTWSDDSPPSRERIAALIENCIMQRRCDAGLDITQAAGQITPELSTAVDASMRSPEVRDYVAGVACVIGTWFVSGVVAVLVGLNLLRLLGRLSMTYTPIQIAASAAMAGAIMGVPPNVVMLAMALGLRASLGSALDILFVSGASILSGTLAGLLVVFFVKAFSKSSQEVTFISFLTISQGFIALSLYSGMLTPLGSMSNEARAISKLLPLYPLARLFELSCLGNVSLDDETSKSLILLLSAELLAGIAMVGALVTQLSGHGASLRQRTGHKPNGVNHVSLDE